MNIPDPDLQRLQLPDPDAVPDAQGVSESSFRQPSSEELPKQVPGFMKAVDMIGSGAMKGSLEFTGRLLSFAERGLTGTDYVQNAYDYWSKKEEDDRAKYTGAGFLHGLGELPAELLTTAPLGPVLNATSKLATGAGKLAPYGLKKIAEYSTSGALGGAALAGLEGLRAETSDKNTANLPFNTTAAKESFGTVGNLMAPMAGTLLGNWADRANRLAEAKKMIPGITNRQLNTVAVGTEGVTKPTLGGQIKSIMFDSISNQTGFGKSARLSEEIGDDVSKYINNLSGNIVANPAYAKNYREAAGKEFQRTLEGMKQTEAALWNKPFKTQKISDSQEVRDAISQAQAIISKSGMTSSKMSKQYLKKSLNESGLGKKNPLESGLAGIGVTIKKPFLTVDDVKNMRSILGDIGADAKDMGLVGGRVASNLNGIRDRLNTSISNSISPEFQKDYAAASQFSSKFFDLKNESSRIQNSLFDDVDARTVIKNYISEAGTINKAKLSGIMSPAAQDATVATKLAGALESAGFPEKRAVDIGRFVELTGRNTVVPELMNGETHKAFVGLTNLLKSVQESGSHKMSKYLLAAGAVSAAGAVGAGAALPVAAGLVSYAAMASIANRSPLKSLFSYFSNKLSPSVKETLSNKLQENLVRGGYFMNDEGILDWNGVPKKKSGVK